MALKQTIDQAKPANFADVLARTGAALDWLRARHADGKLPLLRLPEKRDDIAADPRLRRRAARTARPT